MTAPPAPDPPARPDVPLAAAWLATAPAVGVVGWLLLALSEASRDRALGAALSVAGALAAVLGVAVLTRVAGVRRWSLALSGVLLVLGVVAVVVLLRAERVFVQDVLLVCLPPVVCGVLTGLLGRHRS